MVSCLKGRLSYWYKVVNAKDATIWLGAIPISGDPIENTGSKRTGVQLPAEHAGDGQWHQATIDYDFTGNPAVKWLHTSCVISGRSAEVLLDDIEVTGVTPQPLTNGGFEELTPDRDGTREVVALCRQYGVRYLAYYWAQREPDSLGREHPEWRALNAGGKPGCYFCLNTAYRDLVKDRIVELVKDVGVDGIFFDMLHARADECYCDGCKTKFRTLTGQEPPLKEDFANPLWRQWVEFKYRTIEESLLYFNRAIKAVNPDAALVVNTWNAWVYGTLGSPRNTYNSIRVIENVDGILEETAWYDTVDPSFFAWPMHYLFMDWHLAGLAKQHKRAFMWAHPGGPTQGSVAYEEASARIFGMITNGCVAAHSVPGRDVMARYMQDLKDREAFLAGARLYPWCGLLVSEKTDLWYGQGDPKGRYMKGVYGVFQTMLEHHLPVSLVTDRDLELGQLDDLKVLFIPNGAILSDPEMRTIRAFVEKGGGLVATFATSLCDELGRPRESFGLAELLNAKPVGSFDNQKIRVSWEPTNRYDATLVLGKTHPWSQDPVIMQTRNLRGVTEPLTALRETCPFFGRLLQVEPLKGEPSPIRLRTAKFNKEAGKLEQTDHVGLVESSFGRGKVVYFPGDISWSFFRCGDEHLARLMELALRQVASAPPPVEVEAPRTVQSMVHVQGDRLVVHLLNDISALGRSQNVVGESLYMRRETIPVHDLAVTFRDKSMKRFRLVPGNTELTPEESPDGWRVRIPRLDVHLMVVAEK